MVWEEEEQFSKPPDAFSLPSVVLSFLTPCAHFTVFENGGAVFTEMLSFFFVVSKGFGAGLSAKRCLYSTAQFDSTSLFSMCMARFFFTSGSFGAVLVNLLIDEWMHLLETANYPRVMCFKNCLVPLPTGSFQGNSEKVVLLSTKVVVMLSPANSCLLIFVQCGHTSQISRSLGLVYVASGSFDAVFVNLLSAILRPGWMHLHETDRSPTVMCLTNCFVHFQMGFLKATIWLLHS